MKNATAADKDVYSHGSSTFATMPGRMNTIVNIIQRKPLGELRFTIVVLVTFLATALQTIRSR